MRESQALLVDYRVMMESSPDTVVLLDLDNGELTHTNIHAATLFGIPATQLSGARLLDLLPPVQPNGVPSRELIDAKVLDVQDGHIVGFLATVLRGDGHPIPCEIRMVQLPIAQRRLMHVRLVDISARVRSERLGIGQGRLLEMIARGFPLKDILDRLMHMIEDQSPGVLCSVLLLGDDGVSVRSISGPSLAPSFMVALEGLPIGPAAGSCGTAMYRKETVVVDDIMTDPLWAGYRDLAVPHGLRACWSTPIYLDKDRLLGSFAMYYRDVRRPSEDDMRLISVATHLAGIAIERSRRERELRQHRDHLEDLVAERTAELRTALDTLSLTQVELVRRDKLAALGTLVAGVAHELNTPVGNCLVVATTMSEDAQRLEQAMAEGLRRSNLQTYLQRAHEANAILVRNLHRTAALIASFKLLAVDQTLSPRSTFSLNAMLPELALSVRIHIGARPIKVTLAIDPDLTMDSYPGPLSQVIGNLFDNCLVHAFDKDAAGTIHLAATTHAPGVIAITMTDSGSGIAEDSHARVYDPFFTTKLGSGGSGLGLHVAHNIVTGLLGGRIELDSAPGHGASFKLLLPTVAPGAVLPG